VEPHVLAALSDHGRKYETFDVFSDPSQVPSLGLTSPRSLGPGAPLAAFGGMRIRF
jgi:hypothetical protein